MEQSQASDAVVAPVGIMTLREDIQQMVYDLRRCGADGGQTYADGYADACHEIADRLDALLVSAPKSPRKWEADIVAAVMAAGRPLRASEIAAHILGPPPHKLFTAVKAACIVTCREGLIVRIGSAPREYRYDVPRNDEAVS